MPGIGGLSIANNLLANSVSLNLNRNQNALQSAVTKLSSGLRINTAADDPSGLAIAESLQAQVNGFDQAVRNVQDATNAATVAEGALQTTTDILQRIRTLAVQGASDITSVSDKQNLQAEVQQLLLEVNRISQNTSFNGQQLLDGSHAGFQQQVAANAVITANSNLAAGTNLIASLTFSATNAANIDGTIELQVAQISSTQQGLIVSFFSSASAGGRQIGVITLTAGTAGVTTVDGVTITYSGAATLDVGVTSFVKVSQYVTAASNPSAPAFNFQSGANEGATIQVGFQATNTSQLRIANVNLVGNAGFSSLASEDAIGQIDNALQSLLGQRATLGATIVRLQEDQNNGQETTQYTRLQILVQVGTSVLSQSNSNAQSVLSLFR